MKPIAWIETPFKEKFGVPRQPLLAAAWGKIRFPKNDFFTEAFRGIEEYSHLWLLFDFHLIEGEEFKALVRPPRFAGRKKRGVFATRSPHRPNKIGMSVVKFEKLEITHTEVILWVSGVDLVDGTPLFDIKPYLPYADALPHASAGEFEEKPKLLHVHWPEEQLKISERDQELIKQVIGLDPRPSHEKNSAEEFGVSVAGWNIRFRYDSDEFFITKITRE